MQSKPQAPFIITGHPLVKSGRTPNSIVAAIGADVRTPGSIMGVDRTRLAEIIGALKPGEQVVLAPITGDGDPVRVYKS